MRSPFRVRRVDLLSRVTTLRRLLVVTLLLALPLTSLAAAADEVPSGSGQWPLSPRPRVVAGFEAPATRWSPGHRGVDLSGRPAQDVQAALSGRVSFTGRIAGRGVVVVDHGAFRTTYEPVSPTVGVGDLVRASTRIGRLELFGSHCFPAWCLHWGLIEGRDDYRDPLTLVGAAPVVLLPLYAEPLLGPPGIQPPLTHRADGDRPPVERPAIKRPVVNRLVLGPDGVPDPAAQARGWAWW
jgi:hypothetical protein